MQNLKKKFRFELAEELIRLANFLANFIDFKTVTFKCNILVP